MKSVEELKIEIERLKKENEFIRVRFKEVDRLYGKLIVSMRCAVIEEEHGKGSAAGMAWVYNTLLHPGELPPDEETNAQEYYSRECKILDADLEECYAFYRANR